MAVSRSNWTILPMPTEEIAALHQLAHHIRIIKVWSSPTKMTISSTTFTMTRMQIPQHNSSGDFRSGMYTKLH